MTESVREVLDTYKETEYNKVIAESGSYELLEALSHTRGNVTCAIPLKDGDNVLLVGDDSPALVSSLEARVGAGGSVQLSAESAIADLSHNSFDVVVIFGAVSSDQIFKASKALLKDSGILVVVIPNRFGLKFWAGYPEENSGKMFDGLEGYLEDNSKKTYGMKEIKNVLNDAGFANTKFMYPYPDYKFMSEVFSDEHLPKKSELINNLRNFGCDKFQIFREDSVFDGLIENGQFPFFSNSYVIVCGDVNIAPQPIYTKVSSDRAPEYAVSTSIMQNGDLKYVIKSAITPDGNNNVLSLVDKCKKLTKKYENSLMDIVNATVLDEQKCARVRLDFVEGKSFAEYLDGIYENSGYDELINEIKKYYACYLGDISNQEVCEVNIDALFDNVLFKNGRWVDYDYEWFESSSVETKYVIYRTLFYYTMRSEKRMRLKSDLFESFGITDSDEKRFQEMEKSFQSKAKGDLITLPEMYERIHGESIGLHSLVFENNRLKNEIDVQIKDNQKLCEDVAFLNDYIANLKRSIKNPIYGISQLIKKKTKKSEE